LTGKLHFDKELTIGVVIARSINLAKPTPVHPAFVVPLESGNRSLDAQRMNFSKSTSVGQVDIHMLRALACLVLVGTITWIAFYVLNVNAPIAGFAYVLAVLIVAARWGLTESFVTSVAAMLCLNYYFLPPILSLTIADPQNSVALFVFMATAITASQLSAGVRNRAAEAQARRIEVERLYRLSLSLMLINNTNELGPQVAASVKTQSGFCGCLLRPADWSDSLCRGGKSEDRARHVAFRCHWGSGMVRFSKGLHTRRRRSNSGPGRACRENVGQSRGNRSFAI
jgi:K+-sensing histidine kinase KdpD